MANKKPKSLIELAEKWSRYGIAAKYGILVTQRRSAKELRSGKDVAPIKMDYDNDNQQMRLCRMISIVSDALSAVENELIKNRADIERTNKALGYAQTICRGALDGVRDILDGKYDK